MRIKIFLVAFLSLILTLETNLYASSKPSDDSPSAKITYKEIPDLYIEKIDLSDITFNFSEVDSKDALAEIKKELSYKTRKIFITSLESVCFILNKRPKTGLLLDIKLSGKYEEVGLLGKFLSDGEKTSTLSMKLILKDAVTGDILLTAQDHKTEKIKIENKLFTNSPRDNQLEVWYKMIVVWANNLSKDIQDGKHYAE